MKKWFFISVFASFLACKKTPDNVPCQVRIMDAIPDASNLEVSLNKAGSEEYSQNLTYGNYTEYAALAKGTYHVKVRAKGKLLLDKKVGLSPDEKFTLVLEGYSGISKETNQTTFNGKLHDIFGGAEAYHPNGYLPRLEILRDAVSCEKGKAKIRVVNTFAGSKKFTISTKEENRFVAKELSYPKHSEFKKLKAKDQVFNIKLASMPEALYKTKINLRPCTIYTIVLCGDLVNNNFKTITLSNKATSCQ